MQHVFTFSFKSKRERYFNECFITKEANERIVGSYLNSIDVPEKFAERF